MALGGQIVSVSDEFFAEAFHLLLVEVSWVRSSSLDRCLTSRSARPQHERPVRTQGCAVQRMGNAETQPDVRLVCQGIVYFQAQGLTRMYRCIIKLGTSGSIVGFDIDTSNFNGIRALSPHFEHCKLKLSPGNEAPQVSVEILHTDAKEEPLVHDSRVCLAHIILKSPN